MSLIKLFYFIDFLFLFYFKISLGIIIFWILYKEIKYIILQKINLKLVVYAYLENSTVTKTLTKVISAKTVHMVNLSSQ